MVDGPGREKTGGNAGAGRLSPALPYRCCRGSEHAVRGAAPRTRAANYPPCAENQTAGAEKSEYHPQRVTRTSTPQHLGTGGHQPSGLTVRRGDLLTVTRFAIVQHLRKRSR